jgi:hypothetical protein
VVFRRVGGVVGIMMGVLARLAPSGVAHDSLLLAEAIRSRRGHFAWATCLTLIEMLGTVGATVKVWNRAHLRCVSPMPFRKAS